MASKRKSVTFHEDVSMLYPKNLDGSSSPVPITTALATAQPSPELDPMYLTWLREATKTQYPFIVNGTFAEHVYRQNFDEHITEKNWKTRSVRYLTKEQALQKQKDRWAATPALAHKYGSLGWGSLYNEVSEEAWVTNYREIYRFDGSDEQLLSKIAEAFAQTKCAIAAEENASAQLALFEPSYKPPVDPDSGERQWVLFTQSGGVLTSPDFGPGGMDLAFRETAMPLCEEERAGGFGEGVEEGGEGKGYGGVVMGGGGGGGGGGRMFSAGLG